MTGIPPQLDCYIAQRDEDAFARIVADYQGMVWGICIRILRHPSDAEDAAQETFIRLATRARQVRGSLGGWLQTTAYRIAVDRRASLAAWRERDAVAGTSAAHIPYADDAFTEEVLRILDDMPSDDRDLLVRRFIAGASQEEIARDLGISQQAVTKREQRALDRLRLRLRGRAVLASLVALFAVEIPPPPTLHDRIRAAARDVRPAETGWTWGAIAGWIAAGVVFCAGVGTVIGVFRDGKAAMPSRPLAGILTGTWAGTMDIRADGEEVGTVSIHIRTDAQGIPVVDGVLGGIPMPFLSLYGVVSSDGGLSGTAAHARFPGGDELAMSGSVQGSRLEANLFAGRPGAEPAVSGSGGPGLEFGHLRITLSATASSGPQPVPVGQRP